METKGSDAKFRKQRVSARGHSGSQLLKNWELKESPGTLALSSHGWNADKGNVVTAKPQKAMSWPGAQDQRLSV